MQWYNDGRVDIAKAVESYQTCTAHFIDRQWHLVTFVLATLQFPGSHTGICIAEKICATVKDVNAQDKVVCIVQDEAANAQLAASLLKEKYD